MNSKNLSLYHIVRESSIKDGKAPLLIMLHGYGSDENDLFSFASELPEELFILSVRAPYTMLPFGNAWYAINLNAEQGKWNDNVQAKESCNLIAKFIDEACNTYPVDANRVTLLGFSQGTILSYAVALTYPKKVKNIIALSGYINKDLLPDNLHNNDYSKLDFYCSHGSVDQIIPIDWARQTPKFLESLSINHQYNEFPVGHGIAPQNFYELREWLKTRI